MMPNERLAVGQRAMESNRCFLNAIRKDDKNEIHQLYKSDVVREFLGGSIDEKSYDERFSQFMANTVDVHWTLRLKETNEFIGLLSISKHHDETDYEISYQLLPAFWGRGLAQEVISVALEYAVSQMHLTRILAETQSANKASRSLLEKVGMEPLATVLRFGKEQTIYRKWLTPEE